MNEGEALKGTKLRTVYKEAYTVFVPPCNSTSRSKICCKSSALFLQGPWGQ